MPRVIISVSVRSDQAQFLMENKQVNPSKILQAEIDRLMECSLNPQLIKELKEENERMKENLARWKEMFFEIKAQKENIPQNLEQNKITTIKQNDI